VESRKSGGSFFFVTNSPGGKCTSGVGSKILPRDALDTQLVCGKHHGEDLQETVQAAERVSVF